MILPPFAYVELAKLRDYCLSSTHPEGKHKARVFYAALRLDDTDAEWLRDELLKAALNEDCSLGLLTKHGQRYIVDFWVCKNDLEAKIRSAWIVKVGEDFPRLVSCYVL
jgi:hypothetical protein